MKRIERVLLTTNLAPHSDRAMERAVQLAVQHGADLAALFAIEPTGGGLVPTPYDHLSKEDIEAEMRRHILAVPGAGALSPLVATMKGAVHETVAKFADMWKPDLMVAGAHRIDVLKDLFAVTSVERISVASAAPLLVVRNKSFGPYASALVPVDFSPISRESVEAAFRLIPEGIVHILHVDPTIESGLVDTAIHADDLAGDHKESFDELLAGMEVGNRFVGTSTRPGFPMLTIAEAAISEPSDLIVMGTAGRKGVGRALLGSTAHEVLERLPSDVLLVRAP